MLARQLGLLLPAEESRAPQDGLLGQGGVCPVGRLRVLDARFDSASIVVAGVRAGKGKGSTAAAPTRRHPNVVLIIAGTRVAAVNLDRCRRLAPIECVVVWRVGGFRTSSWPYRRGECPSLAWRWLGCRFCVFLLALEHLRVPSKGRGCCTGVSVDIDPERALSDVGNPELRGVAKVVGGRYRDVLVGRRSIQAVGDIDIGLGTGNGRAAPFFSVT